MFPKIIVDLLFWLHMGVIIFGVTMGLFLPLYLVLLLITLHRLQFFIFNDCLLSAAQKKLRGLPKQKHFLQFAVQKIFKKKITKRGAQRLDYTLVISSIIITVLKTIL